MEKYDVGIGWIDPVEKSLVETLREVCKKNNLSLYEITFLNLADDYKKITQGEIGFDLFIDRASIDNAGFFLLASKLKEGGSYVINDPEQIIKFSSKVQLVKALRGAIPLPKIHIINEGTDNDELDKIIKDIDGQFALKPAYGGSLNEILLEGRTIKDIKAFIEGKDNEPYLVQEYITPSTTKEKTSWWRIIYAKDLIIPFWWDPKTHIYKEFGNSPEEKDISKKLEDYVKEIAKITGFDLFSSEFTIDSKTGEFVCIDYANQPIDLNTTDNSKDALPPDVVKKIASQIISSLV